MSTQPNPRHLEGLYNTILAVAGYHPYEAWSRYRDFDYETGEQRVIINHTGFLPGGEEIWLSSGASDIRDDIYIKSAPNKLGEVMGLRIALDNGIVSFVEVQFKNPRVAEPTVRFKVGG